MRPGDGQGIQNWQIGLIAIVLVVVGFYLAFAKSIPFTGDGYTLKAVFEDAQSVRADSPVRIAGVDVGKVTKVEHLTDGQGNGLDAAVVTMSIKDEGRPIREDATMQLRPRLFLEGNLFVDVQPGTPGADELDSGSVIPLEQTSISVQFDQVLTTLQAPVREDLQIFLKEFGDSLDRYGGAEGFRESFRTSPAAYKYTAQVNEAFLGTEPGDLAGLIVNLDRVAQALNQNQVQLQDLVTNLRVFTGSFAAESSSLELAISELDDLLAAGRPALAKLNADFPALRAFAREAIPGVKAANKALPAAIPWMFQARKLISKPELRGLVKDLRPTVPKLARLTQETIPFLEESRALSSCFNGVVIPWSETPVPSSDGEPNDPVYKQTGYGLVGVGGESRSGDAQGQYFRVIAGGGANTISIPTTDTGPAAGVAPFHIVGAEPAKQSSAKTPFRPDAPCENQDPPNLASNVAAAPPQTMNATSTPSERSGRAGALSERYAAIYTQMLTADALRQAGRPRQAARVEAQLTDDWRRFVKFGLPAYQKSIAALTGVGG